jgi:hypothetical protein
MREPLSFLTGFLVLYQQLFLAIEVNPYVIGLIGALMGLPGLLGVDELFQKRKDRPETLEEILPKPSENGHSAQQSSSESSSST